MIKRIKSPLFVIVISLVFLSVACKLPFLNGEKIQLPLVVEQEAEPPEPNPEDPQAPVTEPVEEPVTEPAEKVPTVEGLIQVTNSLFIQDDTTLTTSFIFVNQDVNNTLVDVEYTVTAYDAQGVMLDDDTGYLDFLQPGATFGATSQMWLDEGQVVNSVDITWKYEMEAGSPYNSPFSIEKTRYLPDDVWGTFTGVLKNADTTSYTDIRVDAVALDAAGTIVGGGYSYVDFVPSQDQVGIQIYAETSEAPASVLMFAMPSLFSASYEDGDWLNNIEVVDFGFIQDGLEIGGGLKIKNVTDQIIEDTQYYVTVYEADGLVSYATSGYVDVIWPGEVVGVSPGTMYMPDAASPSEVDLVVLPGQFATHALAANPLRIASADYMADEYWPTVKVVITNSLAQSITDIYLSVLLFDANGEIVGGGRAYPEDMAANGSQEVEVWVTFVGSGAPASIEAYATISSYSEIGP